MVDTLNAVSAKHGTLTPLIIISRWGQDDINPPPLPQKTSLSLPPSHPDCGSSDLGRTAAPQRRELALDYQPVPHHTLKHIDNAKR